jgi:hypothetical protein
MPSNGKRQTHRVNFRQRYGWKGDFYLPVVPRLNTVAQAARSAHSRMKSYMRTFLYWG